MLKSLDKEWSEIEEMNAFFLKQNLKYFPLIKSIHLTYNNILKAKMIKNHQLSEHDSAKKKIKRHNELIKLYYHKEQK